VGNRVSRVETSADDALPAAHSTITVHSCDTITVHSCDRLTRTALTLRCPS